LHVDSSKFGPLPAHVTIGGAGGGPGNGMGGGAGGHSIGGGMIEGADPTSHSASPPFEHTNAHEKPRMALYEDLVEEAFGRIETIVPPPAHIHEK